METKVLTRSQPVGGDLYMPTTDLRKTKILSQSEWNRIQGQLNRRAIEEEKAQLEKEKREALHKMSTDKVKTWSNTVLGQRQKKLAERELREAKIEAERRMQDIEEARLAAERRKDILERAKTKQYYQTDRVKTFHSALLLTEVMKEREAQLELKRLRAVNNDAEMEQVASERREYEEAVLRDQAAAAERRQKAISYADFQKAQVQQHIKEKTRDVEDMRREAEELDKLQQQYLQERARLDEIKQAEAAQQMKENLQQINDIKRMKEIEKLQDEEDNEEIRMFAAAKRKMMKMRMDKEQQLQREKQERLERIREKLHHQMKQKVDDETDRITNAVQEFETKKAKEEAEQAAKRNRMMQSIADHRYQQRKKMENEAAEQRRLDVENVRAREEADRLFRANEEQKKLHKLEEERALETLNLQAIEKKRQEAELQKQADLAEARRNKDLLAVEEAQFQEYARIVIDDREKRGRDTTILRKAARSGVGGGKGPLLDERGGLRPNYQAVNDMRELPSYAGPSTDNTKELIGAQHDTSKHMGFIW